MARWWRAMIRQIAPADFPAGWREATPEERSHESRTDGTRVMLRLDAASQTTLQQLRQQCGTSKAHIIRRLIAHATPEDVPEGWHLRAAERSEPPMRQQTRTARERTRRPAALGMPIPGRP
jgi:hypothetical protein